MSMLSASLTVSAFVVLAVAVVLLDAAGRRDDSRLPHLGDVFELLMVKQTGRVLVMLGWWWLGWHFFVR